MKLVTYLTLYQTMMTLKKKLWKKEKLLVTSIFFLSRNAFYTIKDKYVFCDTLLIVCKCFQFGQV